MERKPNLNIAVGLNTEEDGGDARRQLFNFFLSSFTHDRPFNFTIFEGSTLERIIAILQVQENASQPISILIVDWDMIAENQMHFFEQLHALQSVPKTICIGKVPTSIQKRAIKAGIYRFISNTSNGHDVYNALEYVLSFAKRPQQ